SVRAGLPQAARHSEGLQTRRPRGRLFPIVHGAKSVKVVRVESAESPWQVFSPSRLRILLLLGEKVGMRANFLSGEAANIPIQSGKHVFEQDLAFPLTMEVTAPCANRRIRVCLCCVRRIDRRPAQDGHGSGW